MASSNNSLTIPSFKIIKPKFSKRSSSSSSSLIISCKSNNKLDRRDVLLGIGGLCVGHPRLAAAHPILPPDMSKCGTPDTLPPGVVAECCPPMKSPIIHDYVLPAPPPPPRRLRVRPPAHDAGPAYVAKYERALQLMKALPDHDPRSFKQQADVHCAYCNGAYNQVGFGELDLQVHNNWLFFPFHRWYLYFYERILGKLIGDPNFAIPFWNWDSPPGMTMPTMFTNPSSSLYDEFRSKANQPPYIIDLDYDYRNRSNNVAKPRDEQINENLGTMYRQMVSSSKLPSLFFGGEYRAGDPAENSPGSLENTPHTQIHVLSGSERTDELRNGEDMGNFYSAARDPMFYAHHGNVDRMWDLWKSLPGGKRRDVSDPDWLETAFLFYDENAKLVRVKVRDCVDTRRLGYVYEDVPVPWLSSRPKPKPKHGLKPVGFEMEPRNTLTRLNKTLAREALAVEANNNRIALSDFPITLRDSAVSVVVSRPKSRRSKEEKEKEEEVLVVEGIKFDREVAVKFDVYVDDEDEGLAAAIAPDKSEYAGTFGNVPHKINRNAAAQKVSLRLGISELLEDVGAEEDESVVVTLVPRTGDPISIDGVKIVLLSS